MVSKPLLGNMAALDVTFTSQPTDYVVVDVRSATKLRELAWGSSMFGVKQVSYVFEQGFRHHLTISSPHHLTTSPPHHLIT